VALLATRVFSALGHRAEPVQGLVRLDVVGGGRRIAQDQQRGLNEADGEGTQHDIDEVKGAGDSCQLPRRQLRPRLDQDLPQRARCRMLTPVATARNPKKLTLREDAVVCRLRRDVP